MEAKTFIASTGAKVTIRWDVLNDVSEEELAARRREFDRVTHELMIKAARRLAEEKKAQERGEQAENKKAPARRQPRQEQEQ